MGTDYEKLLDIRSIWTVEWSVPIPSWLMLFYMTNEGKEV